MRFEPSHYHDGVGRPNVDREGVRGFRDPTAAKYVREILRTGSLRATSLGVASAIRAVEWEAIWAEAKDDERARAYEAEIDELLREGEIEDDA